MCLALSTFSAPRSRWVGIVVEHWCWFLCDHWQCGRLHRGIFEICSFLAREGTQDEEGQRNYMAKFFVVLCICPYLSWAPTYIRTYSIVSPKWVGGGVLNACICTFTWIFQLHFILSYTTRKHANDMGKQARAPIPTWWCKCDAISGQQHKLMRVLRCSEHVTHVFRVPCTV